MTMEIAKNTNEVIEILNIGASTLRKWCLALEEEEYSFTRVEQNKRLFYQNDIDMLQHFQKLVQEHKMQLDQASKVVIPMFQKDKEEVKAEVFPTGTTSVTAKNEVFQQGTTLVTVDILEQLLKQQEQRFEQMLDEKLEQRDIKLSMTIKAEMEQRQKEVATAIEEATKKKGFWSRWFRK